MAGRLDGVTLGPGHLEPFTGEQQLQARSFGDCVLTFDNYAHSSMVAATFCLTLASTLLGRTPASTSTTNLHNEVPSVIRTALPALCPFKGSPLQYLDDGPRSCHSSYSHLHHPSADIDSDSSHRSLEAQQRHPYIRLCHLAHESSRQRCSLERIPCAAVDTGSRPASENVVYPHSPSVCGKRQDTVVTADLCAVLPE